MPKLISMIDNRIKRGTNTTQKDWFEIQCERLSLDFESTHQKLRSMKKIYRLSRAKAWPVGLMRT